jgi:hypothetical protein
VPLTRAPLRQVAGGVIIAVVVSACAASPTESPSGSSSAAPSGPGASLTEAQADLDLLVERLEAIHPDPWHGIAREDFVAAVADLQARMPDLTPDQTMVEVMRLVGLISANGRDGHMFALPADANYGTALPIRVYEFPEGVIVTDARAPYEDLIGQAITAVNGHPIAEVLEALDPLVPRDGPATVPAFRPIFFLRVEVLRGLGLADDGPIELTVSDGNDETTLDVDPLRFADFASFVGPGGMVALPVRDVRWLSRPGDNLYIEYLPDSRTLYVRYRQVQTFSPGLADELEDRADDPDVDRVVLDLRENGGGNNQTYGSLLSAVRSDAVDREGRLFLLTDRLTFSAAANFSTEVEQTTSAIFGGEPPGGGLNFWNDVSPVTLANLPVPMEIGVSIRYWQFATPDDPRLTIDPDIPVAYTAADYFADRDPVFDAILAAD